MALEPALDLLVLGDCNPDLILGAPGLEPAFGQAETLVDSADLTIGGSGAILACGAARLGLRTAIAGVVGDDLFGRFMADALRERGVDIRGLVVDPGLRTGPDRRSSPASDDRAIITFPGTIAALTVAAVDPRLIRARAPHPRLLVLPAARADAGPGGALRRRPPRRRHRLRRSQLGPERGLGRRPARTCSERSTSCCPMPPRRPASPTVPDVREAARALAAAAGLVVVKLGADGALAVRDGEEFARPGAGRSRRRSTRSAPVTPSTPVCWPALLAGEPPRAGAGPGVRLRRAVDAGRRGNRRPADAGRGRCGPARAFGPDLSWPVGCDVRGRRVSELASAPACLLGARVRAVPGAGVTPPTSSSLLSWRSFRCGRWRSY